MRLNITLGIQTPIYTGHCNCNGFIWFMSKWDLCLLTAMNSPLSRIRQPAQSDTLKYTPTMNISHLETNTTESIDSIYILCTAQWLKQLPQLFFFFSSSLPAPFQCNYCQPNQYSMHFIELTKDYWVHGILENFIFPRFLPLYWLLDSQTPFICSGYHIVSLKRCLSLKCNCMSICGLFWGVEILFHFHQQGELAHLPSPVFFTSSF